MAFNVNIQYGVRPGSAASDHQRRVDRTSAISDPPLTTDVPVANALCGSRLANSWPGEFQAAQANQRTFFVEMKFVVEMKDVAHPADDSNVSAL